MTAPTAATPASTLREYDVYARSTETFGRVLCSARDHHFIVDGPVQNGCPGEAITPVEVFLSAVAACGVELIHVMAKNEQRPLDRLTVKIYGAVDRAKQSRTDVTTFNSVRVDFTLWGCDDAGAAVLVEGFQRR
jgi:uncharacterized OsmC-like protein